MNPRGAPEGQMKIYRGRRSAEGCAVTVDGARLDPRTDLEGPSGADFEWGYAGAGPGRLALAILADHFGDGGRALGDWRRFQKAVIATLEGDEWALDSAAIDQALGSVAEVPLTLAELLNKARGLR